MTDTLFADISEYQPVVDDSYPYSWLSIRSNDGTYRDGNFFANWDIARSWLDSGRLRGLIVYCVYRPNWQDVLSTHIDMQGENRPDVVSMADVESWGGEIVGDNSNNLRRALPMLMPDRIAAASGTNIGGVRGATYIQSNVRSIEDRQAPAAPPRMCHPPTTSGQLSEGGALSGPTTSIRSIVPASTRASEFSCTPTTAHT